MPNYKETTVAGDQWQRSHICVINNEYGITPKITFGEETIIVLSDDRQMNQSAGGISCEFTTGSEFDLLNPETDEVVGTATHDQIYQILYSLYKHLAAVRDTDAIGG